jgi:hypothetical protein
MSAADPSDRVATGATATATGAAPMRHVREIIRDEQVMRGRILAVVESGPQTIPQIAAALGKPTHEVVFWVMGLRKYGWLAEIKEVDDDGYFQYQAVPREES